MPPPNTTAPASPGIGADLTDEKAEAQRIENYIPPGYTTPRDIQDRFPTLRDLSDDEMAALNDRVLRRIDWHMLPCVSFMYLLNYLDRINVSNARLAGLQKDLGMSDTVWSVGISMFYVGYVIGMIPGNMLMARSNPRYFMPAVMLLWSIGTVGAGFAVARFFIGLTEAPFFPSLTLLTSSWYTKEESPMRMAIWHAGNTISNIISSFLAAGILEHMNHVAGLRSWQWFFVIEGVASVLVAVASYFSLPEWPSNTRFLNEQEREMAQYRVLVSNGGIDEEQGGIWTGVWAAVKDPYTWLFTLMHFALVTAQSFKDFLPSIIETFGYSKLITYLIQAPPYAIAYAFACLVALSCGRRQESTWHITIPIVFAAAGASMMMGTLNVGARYFSLVLLISGTYSGLNLQLSWETTVVPAPRAKKAALIAIADSISQTSHWFSPYFYPKKQAPYYRMGGGLVIMGCALVVVCCFAVRWRSVRLNRKLDEREGLRPGSEEERGWRYRY
ncbi:vitamin H transporter [Purpureocillium lilacinum]|uniref:Vitamin H transporter n=1 Tax=Purpureocillium lilacinum TaxID=33203 RepID=A0A179G9J3_PURLI|nr:vitamin H transporter [Purpureocillium lilacinum]